MKKCRKIPSPGRAGTDNIAFTSSDTDIATIDAETGNVTLRDNDVVNITATKARDSIYLTTSTQYPLTVDTQNRKTLTLK